MFPAGEQVAVHAFDGGGHRLIEFHLRYDEPLDDQVGYSSGSIGASTVATYDIDGNESDEWSAVYFLCKTCRDQLKPFGWVVTMAEVRRVLEPLWHAGQQDHAPRSARVVARELSDDDLR